MTSTTIERHGGELTIVTTVEIPKSPTFPLPSPVSEPMNTAAAVLSLYPR